MSGAESKLEEDGDPPQGVTYPPGTVVWAKVGKIWWAGQVTADYPAELTSRLRKDPLAVVKFFNEEDFHVIKKDVEITEYQGEKKVGLIWKGLNYLSGKGGKNDDELKQFKAAVLDAEKLTGGSETIFEDLEAAKAAEATPVTPPPPVGVHKELGSALKKAAAARTDTELNGKSSEYDPTMSTPSSIPYPPIGSTMATPTSSSSKKIFSCDVCNWSCGTMGGIIMHRKIHSSARGATPRPRVTVPIPKSSPVGKPAATATATMTSASSTPAVATTSPKKRGRPPSTAKATPTVATVPPSPTKTASTKVPGGRKRKVEVAEAEKEAAQTWKKQDILGDWGDEDGEVEDNPPEDEPIPPVIKKPRSEKETKAVFDSLLQAIKPSEGKPKVDEKEDEPPVVVSAKEPSPPPAKVEEKPLPQKEPEPVVSVAATPTSVTVASEPPKVVEPEKKAPAAAVKPPPAKDISDAALEQLLKETKPPEVDLKVKVPLSTSKSRQSSKIEPEKKKVPATPAPAPTKPQPAPTSAPHPMKVQPAPTSAPQPTKVQPAPTSAPHPTKVQPAPVPAKVQPAPTSTPAQAKVQTASASVHSKVKGHTPATKGKESTPVLATKSFPKALPPASQNLSGKSAKSTTATTPASTHAPTVVKAKTPSVPVHTAEVTPSPAGGPISFGDTLLGLNTLPPAKPRHVLGKKSAPTASASAPPRRNSATAAGASAPKAPKIMTDPPLILASKSSASATTTLKPTATIKPTPTPPVAEEEQPMIRQALQGTLKTPSSDKDRPEHVADKIMHLLPMENADGTVTYMLLQMDDGQELRVDSVNGTLPPSSGVDAIYLDQPASFQQILSNVIKPGTTQPQPSSSKVNAAKPVTSVAGAQPRTPRQGQQKTSTGSSGQGQGQVTPMEEDPGSGEGGNDEAVPMEQTPVEFYNVGSDGSGFDFSQLEGDNQIFVMQEDGTLIDPAVLGLDLQQLMPNSSARVE